MYVCICWLTVSHFNNVNVEEEMGGMNTDYLHCGKSKGMYVRALTLPDRLRLHGNVSVFVFDVLLKQFHVQMTTR